MSIFELKKLFRTQTTLLFIRVSPLIFVRFDDIIKKNVGVLYG